jgi:hypothetical protein
MRVALRVLVIAILCVFGSSVLGQDGRDKDGVVIYSNALNGEKYLDLSDSERMMYLFHARSQTWVTLDYVWGTYFVFLSIAVWRLPL